MNYTPIKLFLKMFCKQNHAYTTFLDWFVSLSIISQRFVQSVVSIVWSSSLLRLWYVYTSLFNHSLVDKYLDNFQFFSYQKESCYEHSCTDFCVNIIFHFSGISAPKYNRWVIWYLHIQFYKKLPDNFLEYLDRSIFLPAIYE